MTLLCDDNCRLRIERTRAPDAFLHGFTFDQLHRVKALARFLADSEMINRSDVGMPQRRRGARSAHESRARLCAGRDIGLNDL